MMGTNAHKSQQIATWEKALHLRNQGFLPIPLDPNKRKAPLASAISPDSHRWGDRMAVPWMPGFLELQSWWPDDAPPRGVGVVMGAVPANQGERRLYCIDIDKRWAIDAFDAIAHPLAEVVRTSWRERTPSGCMHIFFASWADIKTDRNAAREPGDSPKGQTVVELLGNGTQCATAPTEGYEWLGGELVELTEANWKELRGIIHSALDKMPAPKPPPPMKPKRIATGASPSELMAELGLTMPELLASEGFEMVKTNGTKHTYKRPGDDASARSLVYDSSTGKAVVWSSNTALETERPQDAFDVLTAYRFGGDTKAAAKWVYAQKESNDVG